MTESTIVTPELSQLALWNALTDALGDVYDAHGVCAAAANALAGRAGVRTLTVIREPASSHYDVWICDGKSQMKQDRWTEEDPFLERITQVDGAAQYEKYLQGWAAGLEFGYLNPRAATQIVMEEFPGLASQMTPDVAVESMMQLANVFRGRWDERGKWGYHIIPSWDLFFSTGREIGQISGDFTTEEVVKNDLVDAANQYDADKVKADAEGFELNDDYKAVDVEEIQSRI